MNFLTKTEVPSLITEGSKIQGDLSFLAAAQIQGCVEGNVHQLSLETLAIGRAGWVKGSVTSQGPVRIEGRVEGNISSGVKIRLSSTARVEGILNAPNIEVRPGAIFNGEFDMKTQKNKNTTKRAA